MIVASETRTTGVQPIPAPVARNQWSGITSFILLVTSPIHVIGHRQLQ